jgi:hypothetical protein
MVDIQAFLGMGRDWAALTQNDTAKITAPGARTWDEATLSYTGTPVTVYQGQCELKVQYRNPNAAYVPGQAESSQMGHLKLPVETPADAIGSSAAVDDGMDLEVIASATDPGLVGKKFKIRGQGNQSNVTTLRFVLERFA